MSGFESRDWYYNEFQHVGIDFENIEEVKIYDDEIGKGLNQRDNCQEIVDALEIKETDFVLEIGTATGMLAIDLSHICEHVYAIDISDAMLTYAREKAKNLERYNIDFIKAGFLSYQHEDNTLDAVITKFSLHHLPDHWKFVAVKRIFDMLKPGGKLFLKDAMISVDINDFGGFVDYWVSGTRETSGDKPAEAVVLCIKDEYPTYSWIMEGILKGAGFNIDVMNVLNEFHTVFVCSKPLLVKEPM